MMEQLNSNDGAADKRYWQRQSGNRSLCKKAEGKNLVSCPFVSPHFEIKCVLTTLRPPLCTERSADRGANSGLEPFRTPGYSHE